MNLRDAATQTYVALASADILVTALGVGMELNDGAVAIESNPLWAQVQAAGGMGLWIAAYLAQAAITVALIKWGGKLGGIIGAFVIGCTLQAVLSWIPLYLSSIV